MDGWIKTCVRYRNSDKNDWFVRKRCSSSLNYQHFNQRNRNLIPCIHRSSAQYFFYTTRSEQNTNIPLNYIMQIAICKFIMMTSMLKWMQCKHNQTKIPKINKVLTAYCRCVVVNSDALRYYINAIYKKYMYMYTNMRNAFNSL